MIETPRAALTAHELAEEAEFFSFGTNDLTQLTFGYSRDDAGSFVPEYLSRGILQDDPFITLDAGGVGQLIKMAVRRGRAVRPNLKIGVCGEDGGEWRSVRFFANEAGLNYVSCSPTRVPIARLAAAQASIESKREKRKFIEPSRRLRAVFSFLKLERLKSLINPTQDPAQMLGFLGYIVLAVTTAGVRREIEKARESA